MANENRETKTLTTPINKHEVVINTWLTGREKRQISNAMLENTTVDGNENAQFNLTPEMVNKSQDKSIELIVKSVDGQTDDLVNKVLDMRDSDYDYVIAEVNKISQGQKDEEVKKK